MKRMLWLSFLVLASSTLALAGSSVDFTNKGGRLTGRSGEFTLAGGQFVGPDFGAKSLPTGSLDSVAFLTSPVTGGGALEAETVAGNWFTGSKFTGTSQPVVGSTYLKGSALLGSAEPMCHTMVPEPGTLGLLGTGLVALAGALRLRSKA